MNTVDENIKKARRTAYSLVSAGFHGNNGLDPSTSIHILKTYVIPTITYGLEVLIPDKKNITSGKSYFHISDFTSVNQLLLFISLNASCRLAIFLSVESSHRRKMLYMNIFTLDDIDTEFNIITGKTFYNLDSYLKIQILLDCSVLLNYDNHVCKDKLSPHS
jgi:hypothetical protein